MKQFKHIVRLKGDTIGTLFTSESESEILGSDQSVFNIPDLNRESYFAHGKVIEVLESIELVWKKYDRITNNQINKQ